MGYQKFPLPAKISGLTKKFRMRGALENVTARKTN